MKKPHMFDWLRQRFRRREPAFATALASGDSVLHSVIDHIVDGVMTIDHAGLLQSFNPAAERIFGYAAAEVLGRNVNMLMPEPYRSRHDGYLHHYLATGDARIIGKGREVEGLRKDGTVFPLDLAVSEFTVGERRFFTGIVRDITGRKSLETELQRRLQEVADAEERIRSVVDHVVDGIITIDARGTIATFNPAAERIFGYRKEEAVGRNVSCLMPEPDRSRHDAYLANYLRTGQAKIIGIGREVVGARRDGSTFPMELAISEFRIGRERYFTGIVRDITERKRLEDELHRRLRELAVADQRKDQFIGLLGHELRNPLAPVRNGIEILRLTSQDPPMGQLLAMMERQVRHMVRLIDDLLDVNRLSSGKVELRRENVELAALLSQAVEAVREEVDRRRQQLNIRNSTALQTVYVDPVRMVQIITNLLQNASKFSDAGTAIELSASREGQELVIQVRDDGIGIDKANLEHIFEIFVQVDPSMERRRSGLGLGLTLVKSLTELHGGTVHAASRGPGMGSTFTVRLPVQSRQAGREGAPAPTHTGFNAHRRLLIIDDNRDNAESLAALLRMFGHEVRVLTGGEQAVAEVLSFRPDAVLCDIGMPGMSGHEVARRLRAQPELQGLLLIAATGYGQPDDVEQARAAGFDAHFVKPVDLNRLGRMLQAMVPAGAGEHPGGS